MRYRRYYVHQVIQAPSISSRSTAQRVQQAEVLEFLHPSHPHSLHLVMHPIHRVQEKVQAQVYLQKVRRHSALELQVPRPPAQVWIKLWNRLEHIFHLHWLESQKEHEISHMLGSEPFIVPSSPVLIIDIVHLRFLVGANSIQSCLEYLRCSWARRRQYRSPLRCYYRWILL